MCIFLLQQPVLAYSCLLCYDHAFLHVVCFCRVLVTTDRTCVSAWAIFCSQHSPHYAVVAASLVCFLLKVA